MARSKTYQGRDVAKEIINLGVAGEIVRPEGLPSDRPIRVKFSAEADLNAVKHKYEKNGTVTESSILTIDRDTFEVLSVEDRPEQPELPNNDEDGEE